MIILFFFLISILAATYLFTSRRLSPIPYFPANKKDLPLILKALNLRNSHTIVDLGAGDGLVIFEAANEAYKQKLNTQFIAVEINPILIIILHLKKLLHPNRKSIKIIFADMFKVNVQTIVANSVKDPTSTQILRSVQNDVTIFLYISPWFLEKVYKKLKKDLKKFELVSYFYPVSSKKVTRTLLGKNKVFKYNSLN